MEDKRILWVSAAVGIFLLIIVGTALVLYAPSKNDEPRLSSLPAQSENSWILQPQNDSSGQRQNTDPAGNREQSLIIQNTPFPAAEAVPPASDNTGNTAAGTPDADTAAIVQGRDLTVISNNTTVYTKDGLTTIDLSAASERPEPKIPQASADAQTAEAKKLVPINPSEYMNTKGTAQSKTAAAVKPAVQTKSSKNKTTSVKPAAVKTVAKPADRYWVQAASFTDKMNAETARSILADEKIPAEVFTYKDKKGSTYYRLRVGPYTTESEAEYWNSRIKLIDHFASAKSYVTNSSKIAQ